MKHRNLVFPRYFGELYLARTRTHARLSFFVLGAHTHLQICERAPNLYLARTRTSRLLADCQELPHTIAGVHHNRSPSVFPCVKRFFFDRTRPCGTKDSKSNHSLHHILSWIVFCLAISEVFLWEIISKETYQIRQERLGKKHKLVKKCLLR